LCLSRNDNLNSNNSNQNTINAEIQTCFDLSRNIDFHKASMAHSNEKAIAGKTYGYIELGEWVTWEAKHFGNYRMNFKMIS
jgi:hypothetical protein